MAGSVLDEAQALFIRRWGEMGASWGISRTMAEIHALLYLTPKPLCMDDMMERLQISRGNASMNLRQLVNWGLIYRVHQRGDRKEYFHAETDVWQMFETITRERKRREVEPIIETIERCQSMIDRRIQILKGKTHEDAELLKNRFGDMLDFFAAMNTLFDVLIRVGPTGVRALVESLSALADDDAPDTERE